MRVPVFTPALLLALGIIPLCAQGRQSPDTTKERPSLENAVYKNAKASVDDRVADLLSRMTIEEKTSQLVQGDIRNWMNESNNAFNKSGLSWSTRDRGGSFYVGIAISQEWLAENIRRAQEYMLNSTYLGIPAFVQTEGIHGLLAGKLPTYLT